MFVLFPQPGPVLQVGFSLFCVQICHFAIAQLFHGGVQVAEVYRQMVRLALEFPLTVTDFVTWGVKGQAWNGGWLLFDREGRETPAFWAVVEEMKNPRL